VAARVDEVDAHTGCILHLQRHDRAFRRHHGDHGSGRVGATATAVEAVSRGGLFLQAPTMPSRMSGRQRPIIQDLVMKILRVCVDRP
jgi:hypothetical protein